MKERWRDVPNYVGLYQSNWEDAVKHGTAKLPPALIGISHGRAILTESQVRKIRKSYPRKTMKVLAQEFGVSPATIREIIRRLVWRHIG